MPTPKAVKTASMTRPTQSASLANMRTPAMAHTPSQTIVNSHDPSRPRLRGRSGRTGSLTMRPGAAPCSAAVA